MKKVLFTLSLVLILALAGPALADEGYDLYASIGGGLSAVSDSDWEEGGFTGEFDMDRGVNFSGALGLRGAGPWRGEVELSYRKADIEDVSVDGLGVADIGGDVSTLAALASVYYDFTTSSALSPYLSAGLGLARHKGSLDAIAAAGIPEQDESDIVPAWQLGGGASYALSEKTALWGGYRWLGTADADFDGTEAEYDAHEIRVGLRFYF